MKKRHGAEQIVGMLRQADVALGKGRRSPKFVSSWGSVSRRTIVVRHKVRRDGSADWRVNCRSCRRRTRALKRLVADQALDNQILREAARPNW